MNLNDEQLQKLLSVTGQKLIDEMRKAHTLLKNKQMYHGYWDIIEEKSGCIPDSRKGFSMNIVDNDIYVFGGFARDTFNNLKRFNIKQGRWSDVEMKTLAKPYPRNCHTVVKYESKLVLFGGGGAYMPKLRMTPSYNDIWIFET